MMSWNRSICGLILLAVASTAQAGVVGYGTNVTGNYSDWHAAMGGYGAGMNYALDFETVPLGLVSYSNSSGSRTGNITTYEAPHGVTLSLTYRPATGTGTVRGTGSVVTGTGPRGANVATGTHSDGEGAHPSSRYLDIRVASSSSQTTYAETLFTLDFDEPICGAGMQLIDVYDPYAASGPRYGSTPILTAYDGPDGTGNVLGTASYLPNGYNFQTNNLSNQRWFWLGLTSDENNIQSLTLSRTQYDSYYNNADNFGIDNIVFGAVPPPALDIPEPTSMMGLMMGVLTGLGMWRRRNR